MKRYLSIVVILLALAAQAVASAASDSGTALEACQNLGARPLLATLAVERVNRGPNRLSLSFTASPTIDGLVCIDNSGATSAGVSLNGSSVAAPSDFSGAPALIGRFVTLDSLNKLIATISGTSGQKLTVRVYGPDSASSP